MEKKKERPIQLYIHCKNCMNGRLAVGWTKQGFAIWCEDCDLKVAHYDLQGHKVKTI